jgi:hypothetical protein
VRGSVTAWAWCVVEGEGKDSARSEDAASDRARYRVLYGCRIGVVVRNGSILVGCVMLVPAGVGGFVVCTGVVGRAIGVVVVCAGVVAGAIALCMLVKAALCRSRCWRRRCDGLRVDVVYVVVWLGVAGRATLGSVGITLGSVWVLLVVFDGSGGNPGGTGTGI